MKTILNTAVVVTKNFVRNRRAFLMRLLFPVVLILVLSTAFSRSFNSQNITFSGDTVAYAGDSGAASAVLSEFMKSSNEKLGLKFVEVRDTAAAIDGIKNCKYVAYITAKDCKLTYYKNSNPSYNFEAEVIEPELQGFAMRAGAVMAVAQADPKAAGGMASGEIGSFTRLLSVDLKPQSAMDYYSVVILLMIAVTGALTGTNAVKSDRVFKTGLRISASPANPFQVFIGRVLGSVAINYLAAVILIVISSMLGANWGGNIGMTLLIVLSIVIFAQSFGIALGMLVKNDSTISVVMNFGTQILAFLGGSYFPIRDFTGVLKFLSDLSPIKWASQGIFDSVARVPGDSALLAIAINLAAAVLLLAVSTIKLNRERVLK